MGRSSAHRLAGIVASSLLLAGLAGCGDKAEQAPAATSLPGQAELARLQGDGLIEAAREASRFELWAHYRLMQATGIEQALGGEQAAVAALTAVSAAFERSIVTTQTEAPRLIRADFEPNGLAAGVMGVGYGLFGGAMTTGMLGGLSEAEVKEAAKQGPIKYERDSGSAEFGINENGIDTVIDMPVDEKGLKGRVKTRVHLDACPDPDGKLGVTIDTESQMSAGGRSGTVKIHFVRERWLTDDAEFGDEASYDYQVEMSGAGAKADNLYFKERMTLARDGTRGGDIERQQGFTIFQQEDTARTEQLRDGTLRMLQLMADAMLMGFGKDPPFKAGRCVDLQVRSDPAKRTGARPNTAYTLFANPRSKLDGRPAGGTVTATLDGDSTLNPTGKVKADARFDYANPARRNETATVAFEARSRRGVGRASLAFDTKERRAFRVAGGQNDFHADQLVCSLTEPFDIRSNVGIVMHMSGGEGGGSFTISGNAAGVAWSGGGRYTLAIEGNGGTLSARGTSTISSPMGRFSDSIEPTFTLTPVEEGCGETATP